MQLPKDINEYLRARASELAERILRRQIADLLDHAGLLESGEVTRLLADVPTRRTRLQRRMMDPVSAAAGRENETCPRDLADLLAALREGRLLGPELTGLAVGILRDQQLVAGDPHNGTSLRKTGCNLARQVSCSARLLVIRIIQANQYLHL